MAFFTNIIIIILELIGLSISISRRKWKVFAFYTQISNIIAFFSSVCFVLSPSSSFSIMLRYVSTVMLIVTFIVTTCVLIPMGGDAHELMFAGNGLYHHTLVPILSVFSYIFLEPHIQNKVFIFIPLIISMIYGFTMLYMNYARKFDGPYPFFRVHNQSMMASILWITGLMISIFALSFGVYLL